MKEIKVTDSSLISEFVAQTVVMEGNDVSSYWMYHDADVVPILNSLVFGMGEFLSIKKEKDKPIGVCFKTLKGDFLLGMYAKYIIDEEDNEASCWNICMTFDESDMDGIETYSNHDSTVQVVLSNTAWNKYHMRYQGPEALSETITVFGRTLKNWLETNANPNEQVTLVTDVFEASVAINAEGLKEFSIVPSAEIKKIISKTEND